MIQLIWLKYLKNWTWDLNCVTP